MKQKVFKNVEEHACPHVYMTLPNDR